MRVIRFLLLLDLLLDCLITPFTPDKMPKKCQVIRLLGGNMPTKREKGIWEGILITNNFTIFSPIKRVIRWSNNFLITNNFSGGNIE